MFAVLKKVVLLPRNSQKKAVFSEQRAQRQTSLTMPSRDENPDWRSQAEIAQLVEHDLAKVGVASSSLVFRSTRSRVKSGFFVQRKCLSGGIGRHEGLKIPWPLKPCRFEPGLGYSKPLLIIWFWGVLCFLRCTKSVLIEYFDAFRGVLPIKKRCKRYRLHRAKRNIVAVENSRCKNRENLQTLSIGSDQSPANSTLPKDSITK